MTNFFRGLRSHLNKVIKKEKIFVTKLDFVLHQYNAIHALEQTIEVENLKNVDTNDLRFVNNFVRLNKRRTVENYSREKVTLSLK